MKLPKKVTYTANEVELLGKYYGTEFILNTFVNGKRSVIDNTQKLWFGEPWTVGYSEREMALWNVPKEDLASEIGYDHVESDECHRFVKKLVELINEGVFDYEAT